MIFFMIERMDSKAGKYTVEAVHKFDRLNIRLTNSERSIFEAFEDCFNEWVIKVTGTEEELLEFSAEYLTHILLDSEFMCSESSPHIKN